MPEPSFRLLTLGRLALLDVNGVEDRSLSTRRRKLALLAVLATSRRSYSRDALIDMFWGDQPEERARHSLSDTLSHLRRALGPDSISTRRAEVALSDDVALAVDAIEFNDAVNSRRWADALHLYAGPFLDAVHVGGSPRWEQWVAQHRARHEAAFEDCCKQECIRVASFRDWDTCATVADRWLAHSPLSPHAALHLLASHAAKGAPEDLHRASAAYERLVRRLKSEYDSAPDTRVVAAAREINERIRAMHVEAPRLESPQAPIANVDGVVETSTTAPTSRTASASDVSTIAPATFLTRPARWSRRRLTIAAALAFVVIAAMTYASGKLDSATMASDSANAPSEVTTNSSDARESFLQALQELRAGGERLRVVELLEQAIEKDTAFAMAYRQLAIVLSADESARARSQELMEAALRHSDRVSERERNIITGDYHMVVTRDYSRAASAFRALLQREPNNSTAWHKLGMVYQYVGDDKRAAGSYRSAARLSPNSASTWGNLVDALHASGDARGAEAALEDMARALPGHPAVFLQTATWAAAAGDFVRAEQQTRAYLTSTRADVRDKAIGYRMLARVLWASGRFAQGDEAQRQASQFDAERGDTASALRERLVLLIAPYWQGRLPRVDREKIVDALAAYPLERLAPVDRPYPELATAFALSGDNQRARTLMTEYDSIVPSSMREDDRATFDVARGTMAYAEKQFEVAARLFESAATPLCTVCGLPELGLAYDALGLSDSASVVYHRYMDTPTLRRTDLADAYHRTRVTARLGQSAADKPFLHVGTGR